MNLLSLLPAALTILLLGAVITSAVLSHRMRSLKTRSAHLQRSFELLTTRAEATDKVLDHIARTVIPRLGAAAEQPGDNNGTDFDLPLVLQDTPVGQRLTDTVTALAVALRAVQHDAMQAAAAQVVTVQEAADAKTADARREAQDAARAAVNSAAQSMVVIASQVSRLIGEAVREHQGDEMYATLVPVDRLVQRILLAAENFILLSGQKVTRRS
ncbi:MAG: hypothetical protein LBV60_20910, partial [Streptomyces sp.]|nr:hypothetical protein [Streptomyces sp.]